jgi:hypothetical protein
MSLCSRSGAASRAGQNAKAFRSKRARPYVAVYRKHGDDSDKEGFAVLDASFLAGLFCYPVIEAGRTFRSRAPRCFEDEDEDDDGESEALIVHRSRRRSRLSISPKKLPHRSFAATPRGRLISWQIIAHASPLFCRAPISLTPIGFSVGRKGD